MLGWLGKKPADASAPAPAAAASASASKGGTKGKSKSPAKEAKVTKRKQTEEEDFDLIDSDDDTSAAAKPSVQRKRIKSSKDIAPVQSPVKSSSHFKKDDDVTAEAKLQSSPKKDIFVASPVKSQPPTQKTGMTSADAVAIDLDDDVVVSNKIERVESLKQISLGQPKAISSSTKPRVVTAGVPRRTPLVTNGL